MGEQMSNVQQPRERRQFCRVDDGVILRYQIVSDRVIPADIEQLDADLPSRFTLTSTLAAATQQMEPLLNKIECQSLEIADYLRLLDRKLQLVGRAFLMQEINIHDEPTCRVNLSGGGIGFHAETPIPVGTLLEIELVLLPSYTGIRAYGKVAHVRYEPAVVSARPYWLGVEFYQIREKDRDLIVGHVLTKQSNAPGKDMKTGDEAD